MASVYPARKVTLAEVLRAIVAASTRHIGAASAAASLRADLASAGRITEAEFNESFAVARLTPGTNLLALYALLGFRVAAWPGAVSSLVLGTFVCGVIITIVAALSVAYGSEPAVATAMEGARAGALAVFLWAAVRLARPVLVANGTRALVFTAGTVAVALTGSCRRC
ncbi:MAG: chromate transporter [Planctomycetota bacterium]|nr:chromate transporter [Planctomycetota bacterium]